MSLHDTSLPDTSLDEKSQDVSPPCYNIPRTKLSWYKTVWRQNIPSETDNSSPIFSQKRKHVPGILWTNDGKQKPHPLFMIKYHKIKRPLHVCKGLGFADALAWRELPSVLSDPMYGIVRSMFCLTARHWTKGTFCHNFVQGCLRKALSPENVFLNKISETNPCSVKGTMIM
jgi:hypothetical protein